MYNVLDKATSIQTYPFPHIVIENCLPDHFYNELEETFPEIDEITKNSNIGENKRIDMHTGEVFQSQSQIWKDFCFYHSSTEFFHSVLDLFEDAIYMLHPSLKWADLRRMETCVRHCGREPFVMECQPGIDTSSKHDGSVIGPHLDNPIELFGGLLYMPVEDDSAGGELIIYNQFRKPEIYGKNFIKDYTCKEVGRVPYKANTFVLFLNSINSTHGVSVRKASPNPRRHVNFIGEFTKQLFSFEPFRVEPR